jgi:hypothetical protein
MSKVTIETEKGFINVSTFADAFSAQSYIRPRLHCTDGFNLGVVAGNHAFSTPRALNARKYSHVEVVHPSEPCAALLQFAQDPNAPDDTSYAFVPVKDVEALIASHGGLDWDRTFEQAHANAVTILKRLKDA